MTDYLMTFWVHGWGRLLFYINDSLKNIVNPRINLYLHEARCKEL